MNRPLLTVFVKKDLLVIVLLQVLTMTLVGCSSINRNYSYEDQHNLAESRIESMKEHLALEIMPQNNSLHFGEAILFTAHFVNITNTPITLRVPRQSDLLDIWSHNIAMVYSIIPLDKSVSLDTPLSNLPTPPLMMGEPLSSSEFEILAPNGVRDVKLEIPNLVYLKQGNQWVESNLPPGKYWINITYENLYIGHEVIKPDQIYYTDLSAWVGRIDAEPVMLTILP
ncbi:MAG: hypothetical protein Q8L64_02740 [bacterium]|nr:hypothetical protein [bacterium]